MTSDTRVTMHKGAAALVAIALLAAGAGATYLLMRSDAGAGGHVVETCRLPRARSRRPLRLLPRATRRYLT